MDLAAAVTVQRVRITTVVLCGILVVLGLMVTVALALSSSGANGRCLLYADQSDLGPGSVCSYIYGVTALFQLIFCLARAVLVAIVLARVLSNEMLLTHTFAMMAFAIADIIACILTLVSGGLVSHGFSVMCSGVFYPHTDKCGELDFYVVASNSFVRDYYTRLKIVQAGVWISWVLWLLLITVDVLLLWKAGVLKDLKSGSLRSSSRQEEPPRGDANTNSSSVARIRRERDANHSQKSAVALIFRGQGDGGSDSESGARTPPPRRPVPPRPPQAAGAAAASGNPLMEKY